MAANDPVGASVSAVIDELSDVEEQSPPLTRVATPAKSFRKRQPWMEFINIPVASSDENLGLRNSDETRLFEECDDKRLGG